MTDAEAAATVERFLRDRPDVRRDKTRYVGGLPFLHESVMPDFVTWMIADGLTRGAAANPFPARRTDS